MSLLKEKGLSRKRLLAIAENFLKDGKTVRVTAGGSSMFPYLLKGDVAIIEPEKIENLKKGDVIVFKTSEKFIAHRLIRIKKDERHGLHLISKGDFRTDYDHPVTKNSYLGKITAFERNGKEISLTSENRKKVHKIMAFFSTISFPVLKVLYLTGKIRRFFRKSLH